MARGRMLNKKISKSIQFNGLPDDTCRLLATWIIAHLDKNGVYTAEPVLVKSEVLPWRSDVSYEQIEYYLEAMEANGLIVRFKACGQTWQYWPGFVKNQIGLRQDREETDYPMPPAFEVPEPETPQPPAEQPAEPLPETGQPEAAPPVITNESSDGIKPEEIRQQSGNNPAEIPPKRSLNKENIPKGGEKSPSAGKNPSGDKPADEVPKPKKQIMGAFQEKTKLPLPHKKPDRDFWWSNIGEILEIAQGDVERGKKMINEVVDYMVEKKLMIGGPESIIKLCRSHASGQLNGNGNQSLGHVADGRPITGRY